MGDRAHAIEEDASTFDDLLYMISKDAAYTFLTTGGCNKLGGKEQSHYKKFIISNFEKMLGKSAGHPARMGFEDVSGVDNNVAEFDAKGQTQSDTVKVAALPVPEQRATETASSSSYYRSWQNLSKSDNFQM